MTSRNQPLIISVPTKNRKRIAIGLLTFCLNQGLSAILVCRRTPLRAYLQKDSRRVFSSGATSIFLATKNEDIECLAKLLLMIPIWHKPYFYLLFVLGEDDSIIKQLQGGKDFQFKPGTKSGIKLFIDPLDGDLEIYGETSLLAEVESDLSNFA